MERCYYGHGTLKNKVFGFRVQDFFDPHFWLGEPRLSANLEECSDLVVSTILLTAFIAE